MNENLENNFNSSHTTRASLIIPFYNVEKYFNDCLHSITNQTYKNLDIILVNDGATDKSIEIARDFAKDDERILIINKINGGQSSARNMGLEFIKDSLLRKALDERLRHFKTHKKCNENMHNLQAQGVMSKNDKILESNKDLKALDSKTTDQNLKNTKIINEDDLSHTHTQRERERLGEIDDIKNISHEKNNKCQDIESIINFILQNTKIISHNEIEINQQSLYDWLELRNEYGYVNIKSSAIQKNLKNINHYIMFVDSDDFLEVGCISECFMAINAENRVQKSKDIENIKNAKNSENKIVKNEKIDLVLFDYFSQNEIIESNVDSIKNHTQNHIQNTKNQCKNKDVNQAKNESGTQNNGNKNTQTSKNKNNIFISHKNENIFFAKFGGLADWKDRIYTGFELLSRTKSHFMGSTFLIFHASIIKSLRFIEKCDFEDNAFGVCLLALCKNVKVIRKKMYCYRIRADSVMNYDNNTAPKLPIARGEFLQDFKNYKEYKRFKDAYCIMKNAYFIFTFSRQIFKINEKNDAGQKIHKCSKINTNNANGDTVLDNNMLKNQKILDFFISHFFKNSYFVVTFRQCPKYIKICANELYKEYKSSYKEFLAFKMPLVFNSLLKIKKIVKNKLILK